LFSSARQTSASSSKQVILFIDEVDSICRMRSSNEDESTRRLKNQLMLELDAVINQSCAAGRAAGALFVLAR
jgi:SpoVK/Ycf46/Vps4 family AAA+-type ATPase